MSTQKKRGFRKFEGSFFDAFIKGAQPFGLQDRTLKYSEQSRGGLEDDWNRVGSDIAKATKRYSTERGIGIKRR
ncbi:hypothetical protein ABIF78_000053 [Bradyrhizobium japonicum]|uniref:hypothetical protein n=1 Tax=Bradyrhizobium liaoningense TaxID=43992 RepID=UPI001BAD1BDA|nr:hypothetical protein [Bradyrhizobium liaoningense]MBR1065735.1 hypothetical protein [Bradyrhizobium liaoningense]